MSEALLTVGEAAQRLKMHPETLRRLLRRGHIKAIKRGPRLWRIPESALTEPGAPTVENKTSAPPKSMTSPTQTGGANEIYPAPFSIFLQDAPDLDALFAPQTPEEIARRVAAIDSFGEGLDAHSPPLTDDDPTAGVRATYNERLARVMEASR